MSARKLGRRAGLVLALAAILGAGGAQVGVGDQASSVVQEKGDITVVPEKVVPEKGDTSAVLDQGDTSTVQDKNGIVDWL